MWILSPFMSRVSCQKGPTRHAYAWQIGPFWQDILDVWYVFDDTDDFFGMHDKSVMSVLEKYAPIKTKL